MHIKQAEYITSLVTARNEFHRAKNILVTDIPGLRLNGSDRIIASQAEFSVGEYKATLSRSTIEQLITMMDERCKRIEELIEKTNADTKDFR